MQVRIFYGNRFLEETLDQRKSLSIGSSPEDDCCLADCGLVPGHVVFTREGGAWKLSGAGEILAHGKRIREERITHADTFVLSKEYRVAMTVFEPGDEKKVPLPEAGSVLSFGRADDNTVVIDSQPISKHHVRITREGASCYIEDAGSSIGTFVNRQAVSGKQVLSEGQTVILGQVTLKREMSEIVMTLPFGVNAQIKNSVFVSAAPKKPQVIKPAAESAQSGQKQAAAKNQKREIVYQRSPRLKQSVPEVTVEIEAPPNVGGKPEIDWLSTLLPAAVTVLGTLVSSAVNPLLALAMALVGVIVTVSNYKKQVSKYENQQKARIDKYTEHLNHETEKIEKVQKRQLQVMKYTDPDTEKCFDLVKEMNRTLWDRRPIDEDFGSVRIGGGPVKSAAEIRIPKSSLSLEEDKLKERPSEIRRKYAYVKDAPITCSIRENHICGIVGRREDALYLLRNMLMQFAVHHSYTEAKIVCIYDRSDEECLGWVNDLPHALDEDREKAATAVTREGANELLAAYTDILKDRELALESDNSYGTAPQMLPYLLFVIAQPAFLAKDHRIHPYLLRRNDLGAGVIMLAEDITQLPKECNLIIKLDGKEGEMFDKNDAAHRQKFKADFVSPARFAACGKRLRQIVCEEPGKAASVPKQFSFYEMQKINDIREWNLMKEYADSDVTKSMGAPLGIIAGDKLQMLDLLDREYAHGPHGLVAGTTGSGKSEVMLSYLLSLALRFAPTEVSFMIIDFKGGGMANQMEKLPHLAGVITNIDEGEINRSLSSIEAELLHRQRLFAAAKVNNIDGYIRAFKTGQVTDPLPHLIIVVDEFAELKAAHPEFMAKLISAARIGRSLGVHLILATQKPSGQVSEDIWSNSRFQICLRVASREDSNEVIQSPLAVNIREPGRGYLRVGNNEVFELFQSGYSGVKTPDGTTQLDAVVNYIASTCQANGIKRIPAIFLPPLPSQIDAQDISGENVPDGQIAIGLYDDPDNQYQGEFFIDPFTRNTFILGSALTGKTNLLQEMIRAIADRYKAQEVNLYILDFSSKVLKIFETLPHVGGVVTNMEEEKLKNLFKLLNTEIDDRQKRFQELGVSSFNAYLEAGKTDKARIVLLIDNLTALRELYFAENDLLLPVCQNGLAYGISVIASNSQTAGMGYKYMANFANRIALFCNDSSEYSTIFDTHCAIRIPNIAGRCIVDREKKLYQAQIYRAFAGDKEVERAQSIRLWIAKKKEASSGHAINIPVIPDILSEQALFDTFDDLMKMNQTVVPGLDYDTVCPVEIDLATVGFFGIAGKEIGDCRRMVRYIVHAAARMHAGNTEFYLADSISQGLNDLSKEEGAAAYEYLPAKIPVMVKELEAILANRYKALMSGERNLADEKTLVLILSGPSAFDALTGDSAAVSAFKNITGKYKSMKACVILSELDNASIGFSAGDVLKKMKDEQRLLWFGDLDSLKILDLSYAVTKRFKKALTEGDCYYIIGSECRKLKTPTI